MEKNNLSGLILLLSLIFLSGVAAFFTYVIEKRYSEGAWPKRYLYIFGFVAAANLIIGFSAFLLNSIVPAASQPLYPHSYREVAASGLMMALPLTKFYHYFKKRQMISTKNNDDQNM
jgi:hypothetical protein